MLSRFESLSKLLHPIVRLPCRYIPATRQFLWQSVIQPRFAWRDYRFVARAEFGANFAGTTTDVIQRYIYYFGVFEPLVGGFIRKRLKPGDVVVDVGANIGYISLLAAERVGPQGRVVAIEASEQTYNALRANLNRNHASNVRAVHGAVSDRFGELTLHSGPEGNCGMASLVRDSGGPSETVMSAPLSHWLTERDIAEVRFIKIDVEGAELSVLRSISAILPNLRRDLEIICEVSPDMVEEGELSETLEPFILAGFHLYQLPEDKIANYLKPLSSAPVAQGHRGNFNDRAERMELILSRTEAASL
jgi:FkbM family methyltransferase